jgi:general secretion pathway protein D
MRRFLTRYWKIAVACTLGVLLSASLGPSSRAQEPAAAEAPQQTVEPHDLKQATIETIVLEYSSTSLFDFGMSGVFARFAAPPGSTGPGTLSLADMAFPSLNTTGLGLEMFLDNITVGEGEFEFLIQTLEQDERIEILSRPRVTLEKGETQAVVQTVERVPYETTKVVGTTTVQVTEFKDTGVTLKVTLRDISEDGYVDLAVQAAVIAEGPRLSVALATEPEEGAVLLVPEFFDRSVDTKVTVGDRQVLVLGALLSTEKSTSRRGLPVLGEIPVLEYLFGSRRNQEMYRELIFLLKPTVYRGGVVPRPAFLERELNEK